FDTDGFVAAIKADGSAKIYATYLGGRQSDLINGIAADANGFAFVTGRTSSSDFPTTAGAYNRGFNLGNADSFGDDSFVSKLDPTGSVLTYSTYVGGTGDED